MAYVPALAVSAAAPIGLIALQPDLGTMMVVRGHGVGRAAGVGGAQAVAGRAGRGRGSGRRGGVAGKGLFDGEQTAGHFVPEQHTGFIFTVAGEELGFAGAALILLALFVLLWRGLSIARHAVRGRAAGGLVSWLGFQTFVNAGMTMGLMPNVGVPPPFVSYGGSATVAGLVAVGLLQAVHRSKPVQP
ncbi:FtsW/RodA/SpoVE family cell cycle protein [[Actinomadura] parvosata]|uniref:FtsW/RodA/SpoVE family cell cycle protein n=1 Tax=[Actinomadura] parvosata TaxID=1955412 RepID=UPI00406D0BC7